MPQPSPKPRSAIALGFAAAMLAAVPAMAEDDDDNDDTGRLEYMYSCSACHGESARGDGPVARYLNVDTPGLTTLTRENDGEFPLYKVVQIIDGRSGVGAHGTIMPVWGARFMPQALAEGGHFRAEVIVRGRILSIAHYLESVQD
ncbi:c-type cytochrome [Roseicyclus sp.]|uniref:c-type cytochrome n=1 Tax=Roseicyclus sp. TaxID=1914329 RepID=UPI003F6AFE0D